MLGNFGRNIGEKKQFVKCPSIITLPEFVVFSVYPFCDLILLSFLCLFVYFHFSFFSEEQEAPCLRG
jgi:hypothetical protein